MFTRPVNENEKPTLGTDIAQIGKGLVYDTPGVTGETVQENISIKYQAQYSKYSIIVFDSSVDSKEDVEKFINFSKENKLEIILVDNKFDSLQEKENSKKIQDFAAIESYNAS